MLIGGAGDGLPNSTTNARIKPRPIKILSSAPIAMYPVYPISLFLRRLLSMIAEWNQAVGRHVLRQTEQAAESFHPLRLRINAGPHGAQPRAG